MTNTIRSQQNSSYIFPVSCTVFFDIETCGLVTLNLSDFGVSLRHKTGLLFPQLFGHLFTLGHRAWPGLVRPSS